MVIREALHNALRHAEPKHLAVELRFDDGSLHAEVTDDGHGFDPDAAGANGHYGLIGMRERVKRLGGEMQIVSGIDGTRIIARIPGA
jgi:signal transduction histidine kinase